VKLSILMPVYDEVETVEVVVKRVLDVPYPCETELVIVNDGSSDGTAAVLDRLDDPRVFVHTHPANRGKGAAIRTAAAKATGTHVVMCDADLEYSPEDLPALLRPVLEGEAEVVYGTRSFSSHTAFSFWFVLGNKGVTFIANALFDSWISDLETCFKLMPLELYRSLDVRSAGFGMEAEITGKLLRRGVRPFEVPISYRARSRADGKKLTWRDGVEAVWILARLRFGRRRGR
jgi:dolichol-phosphate hexosyltransferase